MTWYCIEENQNDDFTRAKRRILFKKSFTFDDATVDTKSVSRLYSFVCFIFFL